MSQRKDPAWKYANQIEVPKEGAKNGYKYLKCNFCNKEITGGVKRVLAGNHNNVAPCSKVPEGVKDEIVAYMKAFAAVKHTNQSNFDEMIGFVSYFGGGSCSGSGPSGPSGSVMQMTEGASFSATGSRGTRGPIDIFMVTKRDGDQIIDGDVNEIPLLKAKEYRNLVCIDIRRLFYENAIPFHVASSPAYYNAMESVSNYGRGFKPPTPYELSGWILKREVETTSKSMEEIKATWKHTGVSLLSDGWSDIRNRSLINFLVNNTHGKVFLKTIDASNCVKDANKLFELLDSVIEEIGEDIVVQVITDNASAYKAAGHLLMEKRSSLYWTPCAAHCIDLMLEKIGDLPQHKNALLKAKRVSNFIYNHQWVLSLTRKIAKRDLIRPAVTRFATAFLTLDSMYKMKQSLQEMFVSREWADCSWAKKIEEKVVKKIIMDDSFWRSVVYAMKTTSPLVHVLRVVDGERAPAMGFLYGAMDEAKEKIAKNFDNDLSCYKEIWEIIDTKWNNQMHDDLHACAYYLNPQFKWSDNMSTHIQRLRKDCITAWKG